MENITTVELYNCDNIFAEERVRLSRDHKIKKNYILTRLYLIKI